MPKRIIAQSTQDANPGPSNFPDQETGPRIGNDDKAIRRERGLIGILLVDPSQVNSESVSKIFPRHFFRVELRSVLVALREILRRGDIPGLDSIVEFLAEADIPGSINPDELSLLATNAPSTALVDQYAEKVLANAVKRETYLALSQRLSAMAKADGKLDTGDFIVDVQHDLAQIQAEIVGDAQVSERLPRKVEGYHETDLGNAERLVDQHGDQILYCHPWKSWLAWDGQRWKVDDDAQVRRYAQEVARGMWSEIADVAGKNERKQFAKFVAQTESTNRLNSMMNEARAMRPVLPHVLDADPMLLNVANGVLDLRTGELLPHDPSLFMTKLFNAEYDPEAECPRWHKFLDRIMQNDRRLILFLQLALGYCLTGSTDEHCVFFPYGGGANGKTTGFETLKKLFGGYGKSANVETLMAKRDEDGERARPGIMALKGARLVVTSEVPEGKKLNASLVKDLSGGDEIRARQLYKKEESFKATHKLWIVGNYKPRITDTSEGMWRRVRVIPFNEFIPPEEREPMDQLIAGFMEESSGILNWLLEGCLLWQANRLSDPEPISEATKEYRTDMDVLRQFIEEQTERGSGNEFKVPVKALYGAMKTWAANLGESELAGESQRWLTIQLKRFGVMQNPSRKSYLGIRFKTQDQLAMNISNRE